MIYNINNIYETKIDGTNKKRWLLKENNQYRDFIYNNNFIISDKDVVVIRSFIQFLKENNLETLLLTECNNVISVQTFIKILNIYEQKRLLTEEENYELDAMAELITKMCFTKLNEGNLEIVNSDRFNNLLKQSIKLELLKNRNNVIKSSISKGGLYLDYKISSIFRFLNIKYDIAQIKDFKIDFDENSITQYDENNECCLSLSFNKNKIKTLDKKKN